MNNDDNPEKREVISAKISAASAAGWREFCYQHGVSLTAMLEVEGLDLAAESTPPTQGRQNQIEKARLVDRVRRARK